MFQKLTLIVTTLIFNIHCLAQETRELNWQDFMNSIKTTEIALPVKTGEFTIFKIKDINKFLYKVEIAGRVFELQTPIPTELQTLFRLTPQQLAQRANENKVEEGAKSIDKEKEKMIIEKEKLATVAKAAPLAPESEALSERLNELLEVCENYYKSSEELAKDVFSLKTARNKLVIIAQTDRAHSVIISMLDQVNLPDAEDIRNRYVALKTMYAKVEAKYAEAEEQASKAIKEDEDAGKDSKPSKERLKKIQEAAKGVEKADQLIGDEALLSLIDEVDFLYKELGNKNNFTVLSPPVQMDGDLISYTVNITPCITRTLGPNRSPMQFKFDIPAKSGLKVDFGVGPAISFGGESFDDKYYLATDDKDGNTLPADQVRLAKLKNNNVISPGIAAMMHLYSRTGKWVGWAGSFGVGAGFQGTSDVNFSIYTGLSLVFGKKEKVMLSGGLSWLKVERRKEKQFVEDKIYEAVKINLADVSEKVFKQSFFIGITYNLTNKVEMK